MLREMFDIAATLNPCGIYRSGFSICRVKSSSNGEGEEGVMFHVPVMDEETRGKPISQCRPLIARMMCLALRELASPDANIRELAGQWFRGQGKKGEYFSLADCCRELGYTTSCVRAAAKRIEERFAAGEITAKDLHLRGE